MVTTPAANHAIGVTSGLDARVAAAFAARCAELGYDSLWANDDPTAPGLEELARLAAGAPELDLGVGVLPLDRYPPAKIAAEIDRLGLDPARLWIGDRVRSPASCAGSGARRGRRAARAPASHDPHHGRHDASSSSPASAATVADGVLLNWMLPAQAERGRRWVHDGAAAAGRASPVTATLRPRRGGAGRRAAVAARGGPVPRLRR